MPTKAEPLRDLAEHLGMRGCDEHSVLAEALRMLLAYNTDPPTFVPIPGAEPPLTRRDLFAAAALHAAVSRDHEPGDFALERAWYTASRMLKAENT